MECVKQKIGNLCISFCDLVDFDIDLMRQSIFEGILFFVEVLDVIVFFVYISDKQISCVFVEKVISLGDGLYEVFWVEEFVGCFVLNMLFLRNDCFCLVKYLS